MLCGLASVVARWGLPRGVWGSRHGLASSPCLAYDSIFIRLKGRGTLTQSLNQRRPTTWRRPTNTADQFHYSELHSTPNCLKGVSWINFVRDLRITFLSQPRSTHAPPDPGIGVLSCPYTDSLYVVLLCVVGPHRFLCYPSASLALDNY